MPAILKHNFSVNNSIILFDSMYGSGHNYYLSIGRGDEDPWTNEKTPPMPIDNYTEETAVWDDVIGFRRIFAGDSSLCVPKVAWTVGTDYFVLKTSPDKTSADVGWYVVNSENYVYLCISKTNTTLPAVIEPKGTGVLENDIYVVDTNDGYKWQFLYDITPDRASKFITENWIPVNYSADGAYPGGTITPNQHLYGDMQAFKTLVCSHILIISSLGDETPEISYDIAYRQIGIIVDPFLTGTTTVATGSRYTADALEKESGLMIYQENRRRIYRTPEQIETVKLIISC